MINISGGHTIYKKRHSTNLTTGILCALLIINYAARVVNSPRFIEWALIGVLAIIIYFTERYDKYSFVLLLYLILYASFTALSVMVNNNGDIFNVASAFVFFPFVFLLFREKLDYEMVTKVFYLLNVGLILLLTVFKSHVVILEESRNSISVLALASYFLWLISAVENRRENKLLPAIVVLIVAFLGIGRAGVLSTTFLLGMNILFYKSDGYSGRYKLKKHLKILGVLAIVGLIVYFMLMPAISNLQARKLTSARTEFWTEYYHQVISSPTDLLLGAPLTENEALVARDNWQLHNSFLGLHAKSGLIMFLLVLVMLFNSAIYLWKKRQPALLIFFIAYTFRASLDYVLFNSSSDFIIYFYMFLPFLSRKFNRLVS